jgi:predicted MPP superfamily phosphohydrolase
LGRFRDAFAQTDIQLLINNHQCIEKDGQQIILAGLDDWLYGQPNAETMLAGLEGNNHPIIVLNHNPNAIHHILKENIPVDMVLSGHTHNGQWHFVGQILTLLGCDPYQYGPFPFRQVTSSGEAHIATLCVSSGTSNSAVYLNLPGWRVCFPVFRFQAPAEVVCYQLSTE